ncbi:MAG: hypothetical protein BWZ09_02486 [Alphaproteobacteria bacterium ADurb.BinA305]|nr:MAG: hypothetical protein BWZ09_02486 [Alphaproteobacteria bacterium ADurb.BinA305]
MLALGEQLEQLDRRRDEGGDQQREQAGAEAMVRKGEGGDHPHRCEASRHEEQAAHGGRLGAVVVVVEGQEAQRLEFFQRSPGGLEPQRQQAVRRQHQGEPDGREPQRRAQQALWRVLQPAPYSATREYESPQGAERAGEHRDALCRSGREHHLHRLDRHAGEGARGETGRHPRGAPRGVVAHTEREQDAEGNHQDGLDQQLDAAGECGSAGQAGQPPEAVGAGELGGELVHAHQEVVGKQREPEVAQCVQTQHGAQAVRAAVDETPPHRREARAGREPEQRADAGAERLCEQVVARHRSRREEQLQVFDSHREGEDGAEHADEQRRAHPGGEAAGPHRPGSEPGQHQVKQHVRHPVGARTDPERQPGRVHECLPGVGARAELEGHQAAVGDEKRPQQGDREVAARCLRRGGAVGIVHRKNISCGSEPRLSYGVRRAAMFNQSPRWSGSVCPPLPPSFRLRRVRT